MMRALYTAASGMNAQQANIDNVAHNLANVNTTGFKKSRLEFQDLVYQETRVAGTPTSTTGEAPIGLETGVGTRPVASARDFSSGNLRRTGGPLDLAVEGQGFFQVQLPDGTIGYTRSGAFKKDSSGRIVTSDGFPVEPSINIPSDALNTTISANGTISVLQPGNPLPTEVGTIQLARFSNPSGLNSIGRNLFLPTAASGEVIGGAPGESGFGTIAQGFLEASNVNIAEELVNMIVGQRAYEINSN